MNILGLNCAYHESSACVVKNGALVSFIEEERLNRRKHGREAKLPVVLPERSILHCLGAAGIGLSEVDSIACNIDPWARLADCGGEYRPEVIEKALGREMRIFFDLLRIVDRMSELAGRDVSGSFHFIPHHPAHAAGAYFASGYPDAAILVVDGIGETKSTWAGTGEGERIAACFEIAYPHSLGFTWELMSVYLGFTKYDAEKVMGLASYGEARNEIGRMASILAIDGEGAFRVDNEVIRFRPRDCGPLEEHFGLPRRRPDDPITSRHADVAAALQEVTGNVLVHLARHLRRISGKRRLCLSGGVALNVVANARLIEQGIFDEVYVQPMAHDAGGAVGAAWHLWTQALGRGRPPPLDTAYLGPRYGEEEILSALAEAPGLEYHRRPDGIEREVARLLAEGRLVAWFHGAMEAGPRALGHRSLLADPRRDDMLDLINSRVKEREFFRPLAPSVLAEEAAQWFQLGTPIPDPARFMLMAVKVRPEKRLRIPAVVHVDGTSRIHVASREACPRYWRLIREFASITGVPLVLNTSFNIQEPIVCTPGDAIRTFLRSRMDYLVLEDYLCTRRA